MASDLKTPLNLVFNHSVPHTNETLQVALDIASRSTFTLLIKKLMTLGVLYQLKGNFMGKVRVVYMMNPMLARKRSKMDAVVNDVFKKLAPLKK
jgi:predicted transcriptional regulator